MANSKLPAKFGKEGRHVFEKSGQEVRLAEILQTIYEKINELKAAIVADLVTTDGGTGTTIATVADLEYEVQ